MEVINCEIILDSILINDLNFQNNILISKTVLKVFAFLTSKNNIFHLGSINSNISITSNVILLYSKEYQPNSFIFIVAVGTTILLEQNDFNFNLLNFKSFIRFSNIQNNRIILSKMRLKVGSLVDNLISMIQTIFAMAYR